MLDPETPDERRDEIATNARGRIESKGSLKAEKVWGLRKLAYEIKRRNEADYRFFRFETESPLLDELTHNLKITDGVLRFRIFKVDPEAPVIDPPPPAPLASSAPRGGPGGRRGPGRGRDDYEDRNGDSEFVPPPAPAPAPVAEAAPPAAPAAEPSPAAETPAPAAPIEPAATEAPAEPPPAEAEPAPPAERPSE